MSEEKVVSNDGTTITVNRMPDSISCGDYVTFSDSRTVMTKKKVVLLVLWSCWISLCGGYLIGMACATYIFTGSIKGF